MDHQKLKKIIKSKFGSIANFSRLAELNESHIRRFLSRKPIRDITHAEQKRIARLDALSSKTANPNATDTQLTEEDRLGIYWAIKQLCGSQQKFVDKYPQWDYRMITDITGNKSEKASRKTKKVIELIKFLDKHTKL